MQPIHQIVYVSKASTRPTAQNLVKLLQHARSNNTEKDITGLLLYNGYGTFIQVIEGEKSNLELLLAKIKDDTRHTRVNILSAGPVVTRDFPDWQMGFRDLHAHTVLPVHGYSNFLEADDHAEYLFKNPSLALKLLRHFKVN